MLHKIGLLFALGCFLSSCTGYHFSGGPSARFTVSVPFVEGDRDGSLTEMLIHEISLRAPYTYCAHDADYLLRVKILDISDENIGFRYDRSKRGKLKHTIIPIEMCITAVSEVSLISNETGEVVIDPTFIEASVEFDHDYYSNRDAVNIFSLGQLTDVDAAREEALRPLNEALARRIADFLSLYP